MKRFFQTILFATAIMVACSCEELQKDGAWDPVELDKSNIEFPAEGGQETVTALNYTSWWINGLYDIRSHRQSRRSVSERTQPSIPTAQARLHGLQAYPQTLAGTTLQKPIWLFAYRSRGLETQAGIITSISCNSNQNRISLYE